MQTNIEKRITKFIRKIEEECKEFIKYEETFGNQCAYTDRMVENIIDFSKQLENSYNELFESFNDDTK